MIINLVAEGDMEIVVANRLIPFCGHEPGYIYGGRGCAYIRQKAAKFHHKPTRFSGVLVLTDFRDAKEDCVPAALQKYIYNSLPDPPDTFLCRFAVNELESWLMADREGLAKFMGIDVLRMPLQPEREEFPKKTLIKLAHSSRRKEIREGLAPPPGHYAPVGPEYASLMKEFIFGCWDIGVAMRNAPSLERCVRRLCELK